MDITLFYTPHTRSLRPRWLLEELEVPYELHCVDLFGGAGQSSEYKKIHPLGQVPALKIGDQIQIESGAICHWLADRNPDKRLAPRVDDPKRARYEQWMFFVPGTLEPMPSLVLLHTRLLPEAARVKSIAPWALQRHASNLKLLSAELAREDFLLGERFTAADIMVASTLLWLPDTLQDYPVLQDYTRRLTGRPAYQRAIAE